jgi:hypothetical protein
VGRNGNTSVPSFMARLLLLLPFGVLDECVVVLGIHDNDNNSNTD